MNGSKIIEIISETIEACADKNLSVIMPKALVIAKTLKDSEFEKWILLETSGYFDTNPALTKDVYVPNYRTVPGQYHDIYGRPLIIKDPELFKIVNVYPLREGVSELEELSKKKDLLKFRNPTATTWINKTLNVQVDSFGFSPSSIISVLSEIRSKLINYLIEKQELLRNDLKFNDNIIMAGSFGFIVHGHDDAKKNEIARFIENDLKRKIIILHEQPNKGRTIIEKFEAYSSVSFAVTIWTADDIGKSKKEKVLKERARQNVIFETGFFIGKLGRQKVVVLYEDGVEIPSDYSGVIFIRLADNWKNDLRKEIDAIYEP